MEGSERWGRGRPDKPPSAAAQQPRLKPCTCNRSALRWAYTTGWTGLLPSPPEEGLDGEAQRAQRGDSQHLPPNKVHSVRAVLSSQRDISRQAAACVSNAVGIPKRRAVWVCSPPVQAQTSGAG